MQRNKCERYGLVWCCCRVPTDEDSPCQGIARCRLSGKIFPDPTLSPLLADAREKSDTKEGGREGYSRVESGESRAHRERLEGVSGLWWKGETHENQTRGGGASRAYNGRGPSPSAPSEEMCGTNWGDFLGTGNSFNMYSSRYGQRHSTDHLRPSHFNYIEDPSPGDPYKSNVYVRSLKLRKERRTFIFVPCHTVPTAFFKFGYC